MAVAGGDSDSYFAIKAGVIKSVNETERLCPLIDGEPQVATIMIPMIGERQ